MWNRLSGEFEFRPGGVFANIVLADEINRASPKTQSALLEAMEERQVSVDGVTYPLDAPFMVIATQNPIELEGTYPLPEAQLDRFLMRIEMGYPDRAAEVAILESQTSHLAVEELEPVVSADEVTAVAEAIVTVHVAARLRNYIVDLADATAPPSRPRARREPARRARAAARGASARGEPRARLRDAGRREAGRIGGARAPPAPHSRRRAARAHPGGRARRRPRLGGGPRGHGPRVSA